MNLRNALLAGLLAGAIVLGLLWPRLPLADGSALLARIPESGWRTSSRDVPLTPQEAKWLGNATGLKRLFFTPSGAWLLAVTDGTRDRRNVHDPTYCFRGDGWQITGRRRIPCGDGEAELVSLVRGEEEMEIAYWFSDGRRAFASVPEYWLRTTARRLTLGLTGSEPLLFVLRPVGNNAPDWDTALDFFATSLLQK